MKSLEFGCCGFGAVREGGFIGVKVGALPKAELGIPACGGGGGGVDVDVDATCRAIGIDPPNEGFGIGLGVTGPPRAIISCIDATGDGDWIGLGADIGADNWFGTKDDDAGGSLG